VRLWLTCFHDRNPNGFAAEPTLILPLLEQATENGEQYLLTQSRASMAGSCGVEGASLPGRRPREGEQYRFHFDMTKCIGCKCCVVACNEQNGNPAEINWRRVGEIEGGSYPFTKRFYLSMGCNHCVEPTCLQGCPVDAYRKDPVTGIVLHSADACIGCQYCTWNCSYGVPQYNPERGVVGKCDMCYGRLAEDREPACVSACPEQAIRIEIVNIKEWRDSYTQTANAPGLPTADDSLSTTRITLPNQLPNDVGRVDTNRVRLEHPHWPLIGMTVLTQLAVGAMSAILALHFTHGPAAVATAASGALLITMLALASSTLHLGRPIHAYRALRMWKRSWLSREVLFFSAFAGFGLVYSASLWLGSRGSLFLGAATVLSGLAGVFASAKLYIVPARPAWNNKNTVAEFFLSAGLTGLLFSALVIPSAKHEFVVMAGATAIASLVQQVGKFLWLLKSETHELRATATLLWTTLRDLFLLRLAGLLILGVWLSRSATTEMDIALALVVASGIEILGRYLFFVSVVPKNIAASYLHEEEAA
jgi:formate dehydrogenase iron-sulfur subunit